MTDLSQFLAPGAVRDGVCATNKRHAFQLLAAMAAANYALDERAVLDCLLERERLGSTGFGRGVAIPHGRVDGLRHIVGAVIRLDPPVDFDAVDELPVDLVFMLLSPPGAGAEHLKALAQVSRAMRDAPFAAKLRGAASDDALWALLSTGETRDAA